VYVLLTDRCEPLAEQRLDVAFRFANLHDQNLTAMRLGYVQRGVVGAPRYFSQHAVPGHPRELSRHNCLHYTHFFRGDEWTFQEGAGS